MCAENSAVRLPERSCGAQRRRCEPSGALFAFDLSVESDSRVACRSH